eukprot:scaffold66090_cov78-Phaeocystis_antarctica.AAC.3
MLARMLARTLHAVHAQYTHSEPSQAKPSQATVSGAKPSHAAHVYCALLAHCMHTAEPLRDRTDPCRRHRCTLYTRCRRATTRTRAGTHSARCTPCLHTAFTLPARCMRTACAPPHAHVDRLPTTAGLYMRHALRHCTAPPQTLAAARPADRPV